MDILTPEQWISFIGLLSGGGLVIFWLVRQVSNLEEQLKSEREYLRETIDKSHDAALKRIEQDNSTRATIEKVLERLS